MAKVTRGNPKAFDTLLQNIKELKGVEARVGWFNTAKYESGRPVAAVAAGNELGIPGRSIPPRPFFRPTVKENAQQWSDIAGKGAMSILSGKRSARDVMDTLAIVAEGDVAQTIANVTQPPLSPITIELRAMKKKGIEITGARVGEAARRVHAPGYQPPTGVSTKPLNDSGVMIATLTHITEGA